MMKVHIWVFEVLVILLLSVYANAQVNKNQITNTPTLTNGVGASESIYISKPFKKGIEGSPYLQDNWSKGVLHIYDLRNPITVDKFKYDIVNNYFDIEVSHQLKSISGIRVKQFSIFQLGSKEKKREFVACRKYYPKGKLSGYFEILYEGKKYSLLERPYVYIRPATYNTALMEGKRDDKIYIKKEYYVLNTDGTIVQLKKSKDLKRVIALDQVKKIPLNREKLTSFFVDNDL